MTSSPALEIRGLTVRYGSTLTGFAALAWAATPWRPMYAVSG